MVRAICGQGVTVGEGKLRHPFQEFWKGGGPTRTAKLKSHSEYAQGSFPESAAVAVVRRRA